MTVHEGGANVGSYNPLDPLGQSGSFTPTPVPPPGTTPDPTELEWDVDPRLGGGRWFREYKRDKNKKKKKTGFVVVFKDPTPQEQQDGILYTWKKYTLKWNKKTKRFDLDKVTASGSLR